MVGSVSGIEVLDCSELDATSHITTHESLEFVHRAVNVARVRIRQLNQKAHVEVTQVFPAVDTFSLESQDLTTLGAFGNRQRDQTLRRRHWDLCSPVGLAHRYWQVKVQVQVSSLKMGVWAHSDGEYQVSCRTPEWCGLAAPGHSKSITIRGARRNSNRYGLNPVL